jgi:hypothetical protein
VKPDVILGLSAVGGLFSKEVRIVACYFLLILKHLLQCYSINSNSCLLGSYFFHPSTGFLIATFFS